MTLISSRLLRIKENRRLRSFVGLFPIFWTDEWMTSRLCGLATKSPDTHTRQTDNKKGTSPNNKNTGRNKKKITRQTDTPAVEFQFGHFVCRTIFWELEAKETNGWRRDWILPKNHSIIIVRCVVTLVRPSWNSLIDFYESYTVHNTHTVCVYRLSVLKMVTRPSCITTAAVLLWQTRVVFLGSFSY